STHLRPSTAPLPSPASAGDRMLTRLYGVNTAEMELLIEYAYTRRARLTVDNVHAVIAADMFCMLGRPNAGVDFLRDHLEPDNSLQLHRFAKSSACRNCASMP